MLFGVSVGGWENWGRGGDTPPPYQVLGEAVQPPHLVRVVGALEAGTKPLITSGHAPSVPSFCARARAYSSHILEMVKLHTSRPESGYRLGLIQD